MKFTKRALFATLFSLLMLLGFAEREKVVQIFRGGEVIQEYSIADIDYIEVNDRLGAPAGIEAATDEKSITISWQPVEGATYNLYRSADNVNFSLLAEGLTETTYTDTDPLTGSNFYKVKALVGDLESPFSLTATVIFTEAVFFERRMVLEMNSGIYCGFCVRAIAGLERLRNELKMRGEEDNLIVIDIHNFYFRDEEPMKCDSYNPWIYKYNIMGSPMGTINRIGGLEESGLTFNELFDAYEEVHQNCIESVEVTARYDDITHTSVNVNTSVRVAENLENVNYGLSYVIIQNKVGPYTQVNSYYDKSFGEMEDYENKPQLISMMFDDVAREVYNWEGDIPISSDLKEGEVYIDSRTLPLVNCDNLKNASLDNVEIVALLINRDTGEIANAAKCKILK